MLEILQFYTMFIVIFSVFAVPALSFRPYSHSVASQHEIQLRLVTIFITIILAYVYVVVLAGFRPLDAGSDTARYVLAYESISDVFSARDIGNSIYGNSELLFWPFQALLKSLTTDAQHWLWLNISVVYLLFLWVYYLYTQEKRIPIILFIFVFFTFDLVYFGNAMRQALALPIAMGSLYYLTKKNYFKYFFLCLLAIAFHWSSIVFALAPFFLSVSRIQKKYLIYFFAALPFLSYYIVNLAYGIIVFVGFDPILERFELYLNRDSHVGNIFLKFNFWFIVLIGTIATVFKKKFVEYPAVYLAHLLLFTLVLSGTAFSDFSERYFPGYLALTPIILYIVFFINNRYSQKISHILRVLVYYLIFICLGAAVLTNKNAIATLKYYSG